MSRITNKFIDTTGSTSGQILTSNGSATAPSWQNISGSSAFVSYASTQVTTDSSNTTSGSFVTFSNSPAFTITPTITGTYKVYCNAPFYSLLGAGEVTQIRIINTSGGASLLQESQGGNYVQTSQDIGWTSFIQSMYILTAGVTYVFDIQGKTTSTSGISLAGATVAPFYMFAEGIGLAQPTNGFDFFTSSQVTTVSTGITAGVFTTFDNSPAFTITPNFTGNYKIWCSAAIQETGAAKVGNAQIFNTSGSATLLSQNEGVIYCATSLATTNTLVISMPLEAIYTLTAGNSYQFDIQGATNGGGTIYLDGVDGNFYMYAERIG